MVIRLTPELEATLNELAQRQGTSTEALALDALCERFLRPPAAVPQDDWERRLRSAATNCGVSLPPEALTSEGIYE